MSSRVTNYIIWGVKLPEFDDDEFEDVKDEYECSRWSRKKGKPLNPVDGIAMVTTGMEDFDFIAGHVLQMADVYEGEGFSHETIQPVVGLTLDQQKQIAAINALCDKLQLPHPKPEDYAYHIFTQYM